MSTVNISKQIGYYENGTEINVTVGPTDDYDFTVLNNGPGVAHNVEVTITVPAGLQIKTGASTVGKGTFNEGTGVWSLNTLLTTDKPDAVFVFQVTDACDGPFEIIFEIDSSACDCDLTDNRICITVDGVGCCDIMKCVNDNEDGVIFYRINTVSDTFYTAQNIDSTILVDNTLNAVEIALDSSILYENPLSHKITIKVIGVTPAPGNEVKISASPGSIFDQSLIAEYNFTSLGEAVTLVSDGTNFHII